MVKANRLIFICIALPLAMAKQNWTIENDTTYLSEVTLILARDYLSKLTTTFVIGELSLDTETVNVNKDLLENLLLNLGEKVTFLQCLQNVKGPPWEYHILIVDTYDAFKSLSHHFQRTYYDRQFRFLIILTKFPGHNAFVIMHEIFKLCYDFDVINISIIIDFPPLGVCMFTYHLYNPVECRTLRPVLQYRFSQGFENFKTVFPEKFNNFYGCPMRVAARIMPPLLSFRGNTSDPKSVERWNNLSGFEGTLLKSIAESLNFSIQLLPFTERAAYRGLLSVGVADVAIGGLSGSDPDRWTMSNSVVYHTTPYVFIARGGQLRGSLSRLTAPFKHSVWIVIIFLIFFGLGIIQLVRCMKPSIRRFVFGQRNKTPFGNFIAVLLGYPIPRTPRRNFARFLLVLWLIPTLVIRSAYQGSLYDAFRTHKFVRTPSGLDDLLKWKYKMLLTPELDRLEFFPRNQTTIVFESDEKRFNRVAEARERLATVSLRDNYMYFMDLIYRNGSDLIMINEVVYMHQVVMYFPKYSIYVDVFNKKLRAFSYGGITAHFASIFNAAPSVVWKYSQPSAKKALVNERISAVYKIYAALTVVSLIVFGLEVLSRYSPTLCRFMESTN